MQKFIIFCLIVVLILPLAVFAKIGVGVGTGKIKVDEPVKPGSVYNLPSIAVFNTGDEAGDYEMGVAYHSGQPELRPDKEWFNFTPSSFYLEPNQSQSVAIRLTLPVKTQPGDYFAYLEARPVVKRASGTTITCGSGYQSLFYGSSGEYLAGDFLSDFLFLDKI